MLRRSLCTVLLAACTQSACVSAQEDSVIPSTATEPPLLPVFTNYTYFDHHWIQWLPDHPVFEAIEAQVYDGPGEQRFIRVFLTERAPPKRQTYFFNDAETAARWSAGGAHMRDIDLQSTVNAGGARSLTLRLADANEAPLEWVMEFDQADRVVSYGAGLRPSQGHAADTAYIFHYYGDSAIARRSTLTIGGATHNYTRTQADYTRPGAKTGYTAGSYTPVIRLGAFACAGDIGGVRCDQGRVFSPVPGATDILRTNPFGYGGLNTVELGLSERAVSSYTHRFGAHEFRFDFEPALPPLSALRGGETFVYAVSLDGSAPVVRGEMSASRAGETVTLRWSPTAPAWMSAHPMTSRLVQREGGYGLALSVGD